MSDPVDLWSEWLTVERVMARYGISRAAVYKLKAHVRWAKVPMLGLVLHGPSIEALIRNHEGMVWARDVQGDGTTTARKGRRTG